jgi:hypothetical protein
VTRPLSRDSVCLGRQDYCSDTDEGRELQFIEMASILQQLFWVCGARVHVALLEENSGRDTSRKKGLALATGS